MGKKGRPALVGFCEIERVSERVPGWPYRGIFRAPKFAYHVSIHRDARGRHADYVGRLSGYSYGSPDAALAAARRACRLLGVRLRRG